MGRAMVVVLDNYDSFTYNLVPLLARDEVDVRVVRNDRIVVDELVALRPAGLVISPGPCTPDEAGIAVDAVLALHGRVPILGVCLGHQCIAAALGAEIVRAPYPEHGKVWPVHHEGSTLLADLPSPFLATRYHSLVVDRSTLPAELRVTATCTDGTVMAVEHDEAPTFGLQFHPESICTPDGEAIVDRFLDHCR
ncbi:MAG TPA: aminodeoxychorismate/anthranilate synthase component II [Iamia sp.]|nr:aminodeoxychorismate/anthranilate synthase component II [Iamia sp.]